MPVKNYRLAAISLIALAGCSTRAPATDYPRTPSYALTDTSGTMLAKAYEAGEKKHPGMSGFHLLPNGPEALMMRIALVQAAQKSVDMQYYSTAEDTTGKLLLEAILQAASRGVRVRILLDDWNLDDFEKGAVALNANRNIDIRVFNPYATRDQSIFSRAANIVSYLGPFTRRMHNKALMADNQVAIVGGRNLGDEYFEAGKDNNFRDVDVFATGPVTGKISSNFDRYWNSEESFPIGMLNLPDAYGDVVSALNSDMKAHWQAMEASLTGKKLNQLPLPHDVKKGGVPLVWAQAELAADSPVKVEQPSEASKSAPERRIVQLANKAQHEFIIFTPYFVPMDDGVEWLTDLVKKGVRVRIVTNSLSSTDAVPAQSGYSHYREALVKGGVELYEIKSTPPKVPAKGMFKSSPQNGLHAKIYLIDRKDLVIGSFNLDQRSIHLNTEQVLVIHSPELGAEIEALFKEIILPDSSYHVIASESVPESEKSIITTGALVWETREDGKTVYFDFNPHAGFKRRATDWLFSLLPIDNEL